MLIISPWSPITLFHTRVSEKTKYGLGPGEKGQVFFGMNFSRGYVKGHSLLDVIDRPFE